MARRLPSQLRPVETVTSVLSGLTVLVRFTVPVDTVLGRILIVSLSIRSGAVLAMPIKAALEVRVRCCFCCFCQGSARPVLVQPRTPTAYIWVILIGYPIFAYRRAAHDNDTVTQSTVPESATSLPREEPKKDLCTIQGCSSSALRLGVMVPCQWPRKIEQYCY